MAYTTINKSTDNFNTVTYTGNGSLPRAITGVNHQPDFVWLKDRDTAYNHQLYDIVRGTSAGVLYSNTNAAQDSAYQMSSFNSDGFTLGSNLGAVNENTKKIVSWNWKAGGGQGSSNTDGSINTTYTSVNTTAGFSISTYTGNNTANATVGHGLGVTPQVVIIKRLDTTGAWISKFNSATDGYFYLNTADAMSASSGWLPTSSTTFTLANQWTAYNASGGNYVAYCFAEKVGYSKFSSYIGNASDTQFIYLGFKPAFFLWKSTNQADHWGIIDNKRDTFNDTYGHELQLRPSESYTDLDGTGDRGIDFLSNGVCLRGWASANGTVSANESGQEYIFMAFAEAPLVGSNNVPATAR